MLRYLFPICVFSGALVSCATYIGPSLVAAAEVTEQIPHAELRTQIQRTGSLRVIVALKLDAPEAASPEAIRAVQDRLLAALRGTQHEVLHRYGSTPAVALVVSPKALDVLLASPLVASIVPDQTREPAKPGAG